MIRSLALLAALALAACQQGGVWESVPRDDSPDGRACREEAARDPEVRRLASAQTSGGNPTQDLRVREQLMEAIPRAWNACMLRRGAAPAGGVEPTRRRSF
jgi:hypothetical protein